MNMDINQAFLRAEPDDVIAYGSSFDGPYGIYAWGTGKPLTWVAVKGYADDWAAYYGEDNDISFLLRYGDKVPKQDVRNIVEVSDDILAKYRS